MRTDIFGNFEGIEDVLVLQTSDKILLDDICLIEFNPSEMVLTHVAIIFWLLELLKGFNDVRKDLYLFLLG